MNQRGFAHIVLLFILAITVLIGSGIYFIHSRLLNHTQSLTGVIRTNSTLLVAPPSPSPDTQNSSIASLPLFIQKSVIVYTTAIDNTDSTNIYLLNGLSSKPVLIDQGEFPTLSPKYTKIAYTGTVDDTSSVMIYDISSGKKAVFVKEAQGCEVMSTFWSSGGNYLLVSKHCGGSDSSSATVYAYPSGKALTTIPGIEGYRSVSAEWLDDSTLYYTEPFYGSDIGSNGCMGLGFTTQVTQIVFPSAQKKTLLAATALSDYNLEDIDNGNLYYKKSDWEGKSCTSGVPVDTYWMAKGDGSDAQQINKDELPSAKTDAQYLLMQTKVLSMLGAKYSKDSVEFIEQNPSDNNWIVFTISKPSSQSSAGNNAQSGTIAIMNLQDPSHTFYQIGQGLIASWLK